MSTLFTCIWRIKLRRKFAHFRCITHLRASQLSNATQLLKYLLRTTSYFPAGFLCVKTHFMRQKRLTLKFADIRAARPLKKKLMSLRVKWIMISLRSRLIYFKRCEIDASATSYASSCVTTSSWSVFLMPRILFDNAAFCSLEISVQRQNKILSELPLLLLSFVRCQSRIHEQHGHVRVPLLSPFLY